MEFSAPNETAILQHPAMKEITAISRLSHKNIVGYKGCWVEADEPDENRLEKIMQKLYKGKNQSKLNDAISEQSSDDKEWVMNVELN